MNIYKTWTKEQFTLYMRILDDHGDGETGNWKMDDKQCETDPDEWDAMSQEYIEQEIGDGKVTLSGMELCVLAVQAGSVQEFEELVRGAGVKFMNWYNLSDVTAWYEDEGLCADLDADLGFTALTVCAIAFVARMVATSGATI